MLDFRAQLAAALRLLHPADTRFIDAGSTKACWRWSWRGCPA
jgi:hypothetical protein